MRSGTGSDVISGLVADDVSVAVVAQAVRACAKQFELVDHSGRTTDAARWSRV